MRVDIMRYIGSIVLLVGFFSFFSLFGDELMISKNQVLYLAQTGEVEKSITLYKNYVKNTGKHDFSILEQLGHILIHKGAQSTEEECQLLSMYGLHIAKSLKEMALYEMGITNPNPFIQIVTIRFLSTIQDDQVEPLLLGACNSPYLNVQLEAIYALAIRRSDQVTGIINSLLHKLPSYLCSYLPDLLCMIGTSDAMSILKQMINSRHLNIRLATILSTAKFGRDDFLQDIRAAATHSNHAEQEACATALGYLKDSHAIPLLKTLAQSSSINVKLAACQALINLGEDAFYEPIMENALQKNLFAISMLTLVPKAEPLLLSLLKDNTFQIQSNSAFALLKKGDPQCMPILLQILLDDEKDIGFKRHYSIGNSLMAWKTIPSSTQYAKKMQDDIKTVTLLLREQILLDALKLPENHFLEIARNIFAHQQNDLVPLLVHLLEKSHTSGAIALLQKEACHAGAPFIRIYCHLALYRINNGNTNLHKNNLYEWVETQKNHTLIRFRSIPNWTKKQENNNCTFQLAPEETSLLLFEILATLVENHDTHSIDMLLTLLCSGNPKNRYALAGLLLKEIQ